MARARTRLREQRPFKRVEKALAGESILTTTAPISGRMARSRQSGTTPELVVRQIATSAGLSYRLRNRDLPGSPDLANRSNKWAVFVHGCFWHRHAGCRRATMPKRNPSFWSAKFVANVQRDRLAVARLED